MRRLGQGTFARVVECWDRRESKYVAIKIIRCRPKYRRAAANELDVLATLSEKDPEAQHHVVQLSYWFDHRGHICLVFPCLGLSLYEILRLNNRKPFHIDVVWCFILHLAEASCYESNCPI